MRLGYRRLDAELSMAALLSLHMVPPPHTHTLAECLWGGSEAREGGNSPTIPQPAGGFLGQRGETATKETSQPWFLPKGTCGLGGARSGTSVCKTPFIPRHL